MKIIMSFILLSFSFFAGAQTFLCTDYKDQNIRFTDMKLEILKDKMIVSFPADTNSIETTIYPRVVDQVFKISGFVQKTDVVSGAIWTFGVDLYKETLKIHRYIVSGPGFNLLYGEAKACTENY